MKIQQQWQSFLCPTVSFYLILNLSINFIHVTITVFIASVFVSCGYSHLLEAVILIIYINNCMLDVEIWSVPD